MFLASCEVLPLIFRSKRASPYIDSTFPRGSTPEMYSRPPYGCAKFLTEPSKSKVRKGSDDNGSSKEERGSGAGTMLRL